MSILPIYSFKLLITKKSGGGGGAPPPTTVQLPPPLAPGSFVDVIAWSGISFSNGVINPPTPPDLAAVVPSGVAAGDYDNDGDIDLFLGGLDGDPSLLFANNGDGTFSDVTAGSGIDNLQASHNISAAFGDYDLDGDLDLFVAHWGTPRDISSPGDTQHLWRNDTDDSGMKFQSVSETAGISPTILSLPDRFITQPELRDFTFAPTFARINNDLYPDILSVADFNYTQYFINNQDGTFTNATDIEVLRDGNGMGPAVADYDNDGDLDWFVTSIKCHVESDCALGTMSRLGNRLYSNENGVFVDVTDAAGVASGGWGWGACFLDIDNDGYLDIYHTNGWPLTDEFDDFSIDTSRAFVANGAGQFDEQAAAMGLDDSEEGRGVVCADFDNDGDVDILQLHRSSNVAATLWRNDISNNNYLRVKLNGAPPNTEASGARITITVAGGTQMREISIASNFVSQNPTVQIFGLGSSSQADTLSVQWPDGRVTDLTNVPAGQSITVDHPDIVSASN